MRPITPLRPSPRPSAPRYGRAAWIASPILAVLSMSAPAVTRAQPPSTGATGAPATPARPPRDSAQRRVRHDSAGVRLAPMQVRASIVPAAGATVGSGVPARVSVLDGRQVDAWEPRLLPDALASQPGVSLYDDLGTPWKLNLSTRGFNVGPTVGLPPGVTVFVDGIRQNEPDAQEVNFDLLPLEHVERVELLSGNASLLGPNSLGGAINLVTERGAGPPSGEIEVSGGSFGQGSLEARGGGRTAGGTDYFAAGEYGRERGWRAATGATNYNGLLNLGRSGSERGLTVQAYAARSRAETAGSLPERLFDIAPRTNFTAGDFDDLAAQQLAFSGYAHAAAGRGALTAYVRHSGGERFNVNQAPDPSVRSRTSNLTIGATADWRRVVAAVGPGALALRLGLDGSASRVRARIYAEPTASAASDTADDAGRDTRLGLTTDVKSPSVDLAGYALADYRIGRLTLSAGGRYDVVRVPFRNQLRPDDDTANDFHNVSPRLGATVALARGASVYASVGRSFRAPALLELGCADPEAACPLPFALGDDPPLRPVRATTSEVGGQLARGPVVATASVYRTDVRDEIFFVASERSLVSGYFTNLDRTRREGVELGLQGTAAGTRLTWYANYAWTRATFQSDAALFSARGDDDVAGSPLSGENDVGPGSRLPLVPDQQVKAGALVRAGAGVSLGVDARYTGQQWLRGDEANATAPLPAYTIASARLGYARGGWEVAGVATNLFDIHRATFGTFNVDRQTGVLTRFLTPLNGRTVKLTLRRSLGRPGDDTADP